MLVKLKTLASKVLFRIAFAGLIFLQFVLLVLFLWGISKIVPEDYGLFSGILITLVLMSPFAIGANSYFLFQRITRVQYILSESEKWLTRRRECRQRTKHRKILRRWALWIPTLTVVLLCVFMDYTWAFTSHLFHFGSGKLIGYEVSIPLTWSIAYSDARTSDNTFSIVVAERYRGLIKAGSGLNLGRRPPFSVSNMSFRSAPAGDELATRPGSEVISVQLVRFANDSIKCWEEVPPRWMTSGRYIDCSTVTGNFSAGFSGTDEDVAEFYRVLRSAKRRN